MCKAFLEHLEIKKKSGIQEISPEYNTSVGEVANIICSFKSSRVDLTTERVGNGLTRALYSCYLSYMSPKQFSYRIPCHSY